jgi:hypothetical protein
MPTRPSFDSRRFHDVGYAAVGHDRRLQGMLPSTVGQDARVAEHAVKQRIATICLFVPAFVEVGGGAVVFLVVCHDAVFVSETMTPTARRQLVDCGRIR